MNYTCKETCNMDKHCGNKHCSANPKYIPTVNEKFKSAYTQRVHSFLFIGTNCPVKIDVSPKPKKEKK